MNIFYVEAFKKISSFPTTPLTYTWYIVYIELLILLFPFCYSGRFESRNNNMQISRDVDSSCPFYLVFSLPGDVFIATYKVYLRIASRVTSHLLTPIMYMHMYVHPRRAWDFSWGVAAGFNLFKVRGESELAKRFPLTRTRSFDSIFTERIFDSRWGVKKESNENSRELLWKRLLPEKIILYY